MAPPVLSAAGALRDTLGNPAIRRIEIAWTIGTAADWAFLVVLLVVAYDAGGAFAVGVLGAIRVLPAIVAAPSASALVQRFRGDRVLTAINVVRALGTVATAAVIAAGLPIAITFILAALVAGAGSLVRPIQNALLPAFARTPAELVAANVASSTGEGAGTFVGPFVAGALVAWTGSVPATVLVAAGFAVAAAAVTGIRFEREVDARGGGGDQAHIRPAEAYETVRRYPGSLLVLGDFVAQTFVRGLLVTLIVVAALELLGMGDSGVGLLNGMLGLGGLLGALGALGLVGGASLPRIFALALAGWGLPIVLIGLWPSPVLAACALAVTGVSNALLDVSGFTLVQRGVRNEDRITVFGVSEGAFGVGLLVGSFVGPVLVALLGTRPALVVAGAVLPLLALFTYRPVARHFGRDRRLDDLTELLRSNPLFAPLPLTALDRLAEDVVPRSFAPGDVLMSKGELGDEYLVIAEGEVEARDGERSLRICRRGDGVGEIALLRRVPRTATVVARTQVRAYALDAETFLGAVAGPAAAAAAESVAASRLAHPRGHVEGPAAG